MLLAALQQTLLALGWPDVVRDLVLEQQRHGKGHVPTGGEAGERHAVGVEVVLGRVLGEPEDRVGAVLDGGGEGVLGREPVVDADDDGADLFRDGVGPASIVVGVAEGEAAAMEVDEARVSFTAAGVFVLLVAVRQVEVEIKVALQGRDARRDVDGEGRAARPRRCQLVQKHADAHQAAPGFGLEDEQPSRSVAHVGEVIWTDEEWTVSIIEEGLWWFMYFVSDSRSGGSLVCYMGL